MTHSVYALSAFTAPAQDPSATYTTVLDPDSQTGVHFDADGNAVSPSRMSDGTGTGTGYPKPDHDTD